MMCTACLFGAHAAVGRGMLRVTGAAVLCSVFFKKQKENGMPAKIMVSRAGHTPGHLRETAPRN